MQQVCNICAALVCRDAERAAEEARSGAKSAGAKADELASKHNAVKQGLGSAQDEVCIVLKVMHFLSSRGFWTSLVLPLPF